MRAVIDDFPGIGVSRLRAAAHIRPTDTHTTIVFHDLPPDPDTNLPPTFTVPLQHIHFPNGGGWSFFVCPCGQRARTIRLLSVSAPDDPTPATPMLACHRCLKQRGYRNKVEMFSHHSKRYLHTAPRRLAMLTAPSLWLHPDTPTRRMNKRGFMQARLRRSLAIARIAALEAHDRALARARRR